MGQVKVFYLSPINLIDSPLIKNNNNQTTTTFLCTYIKNTLVQRKLCQ